MKNFSELIKNPSYRVYPGKKRKIGIVIDNVPYILKVESSTHNKNSILSEYIANKIYSKFLPTQEVILGKINNNNSEKLCLACKDFIKINEYLYEFLEIKNSVLYDKSNAELNTIIKVIEKQKFYEANELKKRFWNMFVIDAYLGNFNRGNEICGILVNDTTKIRKLPPVYASKACFYSEMDDEEIKLFCLVYNKIPRSCNIKFQ